MRTVSDYKFCYESALTMFPLSFESTSTYEHSDKHILLRIGARSANHVENSVFCPRQNHNKFSVQYLPLLTDSFCVAVFEDFLMKIFKYIAMLNNYTVNL